MSMLRSRLGLSTQRPFSPTPAPVPPGRTISMTRVVGPESPDWARTMAASGGGPESQAIDTSPDRAKGPDDFSTIGFIRPTFQIVKPGSVTVDGS